MQDTLNEILPAELLLHIFSFLDLVEDYSTARVCRYWYTLFNDKGLFYERYVAKASPEVRKLWCKYIPAIKDGQIALYDNRINNLKFYYGTIKPHFEFLCVNTGVLQSERLLDTITKHVQCLVNLELPDFSPTEFRDFLVSMKAHFNDISKFLSWLDYFIELYDIPYVLEPFSGDNTSALDDLAQTNGVQGAGVYWKAISSIIIDNRFPKLALPFIQKYFSELHWDVAVLYRAITEEFIKAHPILHPKLNWATVCIHVVLSEEFIDREILAKHRSLHINYIVIHQRFSLNLVRKYRDRFAEMDIAAKQSFFMQHEITFEDIL